MPRMTKKYTRALGTAEMLDISTRCTAETLYTALGEHNHHWNSETGQWENYAAMDADPPSDLLRVRVWAAHEETPGIAAIIAAAMANNGFRLAEHSEPYPCRPPKQAESRIYLSFIFPNGQGLRTED